MSWIDWLAIAYVFIYLAWLQTWASPQNVTFPESPRSAARCAGVSGTAKAFRRKCITFAPVKAWRNVRRTG